MGLCAQARVKQELGLARIKRQYNCQPNIKEPRIAGMCYAGLFDSIDLFHIKIQSCPMTVSNPKSSM